MRDNLLTVFLISVCVVIFGMIAWLSWDIVSGNLDKSKLCKEYSKSIWEYKVCMEVKL
jgi:hypothetical protein